MKRILQGMMNTMNSVNPPRMTALKKLHEAETGGPFSILIGTILSARTKDETTNSFGNDIISYKSGFGQGGQTIKYYEKIKLGKRIYDADEWPLYSKVVKFQKDFANEPIILIRNLKMQKK